jgi:hypothetical protein
MTPWDDASGEYNDVDDDYHDPSDDEFNEYEDERAALRGTSQCDGTCDPQCDWCLVSHDCPDAHGDGPCPYDSLDAEHDAIRKELDALDGPIVLPNDVRIEVLECNGNAAELFKRAEDDASTVAYHGIIGCLNWRTCECSSCVNIRSALDRITERRI